MWQEAGFGATAPTKLSGAASGIFWEGLPSFFLPPGSGSKSDSAAVYAMYPEAASRFSDTEIYNTTF